MKIPYGRMLSLAAMGGVCLASAGIDWPAFHAPDSRLKKAETEPSQCAVAACLPSNDPARCAAAACSPAIDPARWAPLAVDMGTVFSRAPR